MKDNDNFDEEKIIDEVIKEELSELSKSMRKAQIRKNIIFTVFFIVMILFFALISVDWIVQVWDFFKNNSFEDNIDALKIIGLCSGISAVFYGIFHVLKKKRKAFHDQSELSLIGLALCCAAGLYILGIIGYALYDAVNPR